MEAGGGGGEREEERLVVSGVVLKGALEERERGEVDEEVVLERRKENMWRPFSFFSPPLFSPFVSLLSVLSLFSSFSSFFPPSSFSLCVSGNLSSER